MVVSCTVSILSAVLSSAIASLLEVRLGALEEPPRLLLHLLLRRRERAAAHLRVELLEVDRAVAVAVPLAKEGDEVVARRVEAELGDAYSGEAEGDPWGDLGQIEAEICVGCRM